MQTGKTQSRERLMFLDDVRGFAMICIILGHLGIKDINRFVFTFHLPVFYLITGYYISQRGTYREFVRKKFRTLIVPYYFTCVLIILISFPVRNLFFGSGGKEAVLEWTGAALYGAGDNYREPFPIRGIGAIWFLWSTFWGSLLLRWLQTKQPEFRIASVITILLVTELSRKLFWFPLSIQTAGTALMYMYFGYLVRTVRPQLENSPKEVKAAALLFACCMWAEFVLHFKSFWLVHADLGRGIGDIAASLCACGVLIVLFRKLEEKKLPGIRLFAFLGKYSILMLCMHIIELDLFPWYKLQEHLVSLGVAERLTFLFVISGKLLWSVGLTWLMAHWSCTQRIFGFKEKTAA